MINRNRMDISVPSSKRILDEYRMSLEAANRSHRTIYWYIDIVRRFFSFLESSKLMKPIPELGREELRAYIRYLQDSRKWPNRQGTREEKSKLSPYSIQGHVRAVKAFWSWLTDEGYIEENHLTKFPLPKVPQQLPRILTEEQLGKLIAWVDRATPVGTRQYCILLLFLDTGMRVSELVHIKLGDLNLQYGSIKVTGKGRKERLVPIARETRRELRRYLNHTRALLCTTESPYLFTTLQGDPISVNSVQQFIRRLAIRAGLEGVKCSPHVFRHTFATQALAHGANVIILKDIMGHASLQTTQKHTHLQPQDLQSLHAAFSPVTHLIARKSKKEM